MFICFFVASILRRTFAPWGFVAWRHFACARVEASRAAQFTRVRGGLAASSSGARARSPERFGKGPSRRRAEGARGGLDGQECLMEEESDDPMMGWRRVDPNRAGCTRSGKRLCQGAGSVWHLHVHGRRVHDSSPQGGTCTPSRGRRKDVRSQRMTIRDPKKASQVLMNVFWHVHCNTTYLKPVAAFRPSGHF